MWEAAMCRKRKLGKLLFELKVTQITIGKLQVTAMAITTLTPLKYNPQDPVEP
jgi:hypothetical protein